MRATSAIEKAISIGVADVRPTTNTSAIASVGTTPARAPRQRARRPAWGGSVSVESSMTSPKVAQGGNRRNDEDRPPRLGPDRIVEHSRDRIRHGKVGQHG